MHGRDVSSNRMVIIRVRVKSSKINIFYTVMIDDRLFVHTFVVKIVFCVMSNPTTCVRRMDSTMSGVE